MTFPQNDDVFEDVKIDRVEGNVDKGWELHSADGWCFWCPPESPIVPASGMTARFYGRGIGASVRGLFIEGQQVFYRTEAEHKEHSEIQRYGKDAADWLKRWDAGEGVWSIEMGGLGPGYEQAIQIAAAEVLRHMLNEKYDATCWGDDGTWKQDIEKIEKAGFANERVKGLGLSGAQWGAAVNLASCLYRMGPHGLMNDEKVKDRHIRVARQFPVAA